MCGKPEFSLAGQSLFFHREIVEKQNFSTDHVERKKKISFTQISFPLSTATVEKITGRN